MADLGPSAARKPRAWKRVACGARQSSAADFPVSRMSADPCHASSQTAKRSSGPFMAPATPCRSRQGAAGAAAPTRRTLWPVSGTSASPSRMRTTQPRSPTASSSSGSVAVLQAARPNNSPAIASLRPTCLDHLSTFPPASGVSSSLARGLRRPLRLPQR